MIVIFEGMDIQAEKLDLIHWMTQLSDESIIEKIKALRKGTTYSVNQEMELRAEESQEAIEKGEVVNLDEFKNANQEWLKNQSTK